MSKEIISITKRYSLRKAIVKDMRGNYSDGHLFEVYNPKKEIIEIIGMNWINNAHGNTVLYIATEIF